MYFKWLSSSFCRFLTGNSTTCSHKYKRLKIRSASKIKFICPNVATVLRTTSEEVSKTNKFENLWLLYNRESFDKCDTALDINVTKPLFQCTNPTQLEFYSITFQRYAALPDQQVFKKGNSYYIIGEWQENADYDLYHKTYLFRGSAHHVNHKQGCDWIFQPSRVAGFHRQAKLFWTITSL